MVTHFHVKMLENGGKNVFTEKDTRKKVPLVLLVVKIALGKVATVFLVSVNKQASYSL